MAIASGLPIELTRETLKTWMATEGVNLKQIAIFSLVGLPYTVKFLWAPIVDAWVPRFLDRRRSWMVICQGVLFVITVLMAFFNPREQPAMMAYLAFCLAFVSATQDIVIDAYRAEVLDANELGAGAGIAILGYRIGMIITGAVALVLADHFPWRVVYLMMGTTFFIGTIAALLGPNVSGEVKPPQSFRDAVVLPFVSYFKQRGSVEILGFILLYKIGDVLASVLTGPFFVQLGFTLTEIGVVKKGVGLFATILGSLIGGAIMSRLTMKHALLYFGFLQALSTLCFGVLAVIGPDRTFMVVTIVFENLSAGFGTAAFIGFLMGLCNRRFTGTQYALLSSLAAVSGVFLGSGTGFVITAIGWPMFFTLCTALAVPGMLLIMYRFDYWDTGEGLALSRASF